MLVRRGFAVAASFVLALPALGALDPTVAEAPTLSASPRALPWTAPVWHPNAAALAVLPELDGDGPSPFWGVTARAAFVYDVDASEVLYERSADDPRPVASLTKLVSSLAMASEAPDLEQEQCVDLRFYPSRNGAFSKLSTGECYRGWDLLGAALVASDNRAAYGLQVVSGLEFTQFVGRMTEVSRELGMSRSRWADPSGLEDDNLSTAREMTKAAIAVAAHPVLSMAATADAWTLLPTEGRERTLPSTDRLASRDDVEVLAAKTGYTDTAGYCFTAVVRTASGRTIAMTLLGSPSTATRWRDVEKVLQHVK